MCAKAGEWLSGGVFSDASDPGKPARKQAKKQEKALKEGMAQIDAAFAGYTPEWYAQRALASEKAALPGINEQYANARNELQFGLANRGLERSSTGMLMGDRLNRQLVSAKLNAADTGMSEAQALQQQVENYRNSLVGQLQSAVSPTSNSLAFMQQAAGLQVPGSAGVLSTAMGDFAKDYLMANLATTNPNVSFTAPQSQFNSPKSWYDYTPPSGTSDSPKIYG